MKICAMNNPRETLLKQIQYFGEAGFDAFELTLEHPNSMPDEIDSLSDKIKAKFDEFNFTVLGHIPWFFEITHPYDSVRDAYFSEVERIFKTCSRFKIKYVTLHPDIRGFGRSHKMKAKLLGDSLRILSDKAKEFGITLGVENMDENILPTNDLFDVLQGNPDLGFTLDVGHANLGVRDTKHIKHLIRKFKKRLKHVHLHDNKGLSDDHLPVGAGWIDWREVVDCLSKNNYDEAVTLEVHSKDRDLLELSKEKLKAHLI